jgi:two-component system chemotaxis response regulator CheY
VKIRRDAAINIAGLSFLLADPNPHSAALIHGILRGFGANRVIEVRNRHDTIQVLTDQKVDMMMIEPNLPPGSGGLAFVRAIRHDPDNPCRTLPIVVVTGDTRISTVKAARDCGASMVVAKPLSPKGLYDRLAWVAFRPRPFAETNNYFGPDRRFQAGSPDGGGKRTGDNGVTGAADEGAMLSQSEIDTLLQNAQTSG